QSLAVDRRSSGNSDEPNEPSSLDVTRDLTSALGQPLAHLLKRPEVTIEQLVPVLRSLAPEVFLEVLANDERPFLARPEPSEGANDGFLPSSVRNELKSVETEIKY